uniref:DUF2975 domain-containing protein n=1 Tax=Ignavibacterium album TaxID=591197 RepID=A0A7V2ZKJ7_9BACT
MKRKLIFFQLFIILISLAAFVFLLWEPHIEGRNAHSTIYEIYFKDPFLVYVYLASVPFFIALYQAIKVVGYSRQNNFYSKASLKALRTIKYCALSIIGFVIIGEIIILSVESDDHAGGVFMGFLVILISVVMAAIAAKFEINLIRRMDIISVKDFTT